MHREPSRNQWHMHQLCRQRERVVSRGCYQLLCRQWCVRTPTRIPSLTYVKGASPGSFLPRVVLPANCEFFEVGLPGLEPGTSSLSGKHNALLELSRVCKFPANTSILTLMLFSTFQDIGLGCCTVAAHNVRSAGLEPATFSVRSWTTGMWCSVVSVRKSLYSSQILILCRG